MKALTITLMCLVLLVGCKAQTKEMDRRTVDLNNMAVEVLRKDGDHRDSILKSMIFLDSAIKIDNHDYHAYVNKAKALCLLGDDSGAIKNIDYALEIASFPELKMYKAFLLDRSELALESKKLYEEVCRDYDRKIAENEKNVSARINKAFVLFFVDSSDLAIKEFRKIKKDFPGDVTVSIVEKEFLNFDKKAFLRSFCLSDKL